MLKRKECISVLIHFKSTHIPCLGWLLEMQQSWALKGTEAYLSIMASLELSFTMFLSDGMSEMRQYLYTPSARKC